MVPSLYAPFVLGVAALGLLAAPLAAEAASTPADNDIRDAAQRLLKLKPSPGAPLVNSTYDRSRTGTEDGCPVGWAECSYRTCYPLDGAQCCSDGNYCRAGYYCDAGGCCPRGKICAGGAPPPSTVHYPSTSTSRPTTTASQSLSLSFSSGSASATGAPTTSVGFSSPDHGQSTEYGSVTMPSVGPGGTTSGRPATASSSSTDTDLPDFPSETDTALGSAPTGSQNAARGVRFGVGLWVGVVVAAVCLVT